MDHVPYRGDAEGAEAAEAAEKSLRIQEGVDLQIPDLNCTPI
jgi:hypothetical protein